MCTVTYIPQGKDSFILTSNRDEQPSRSPQNITLDSHNDLQLAFPRDNAAGGTWVAISNDDRMVCLLNGAFEKHTRKPAYKKSRGIMVLEFFHYPSAAAFLEKYDLHGMEPFTMIIAEKGSLTELIWDEKEKHINALNSKAFYIWSSATLYPKAIKAKRESWFRNWLAESSALDLENIMDFHLNAGDGDPHNNVRMNRNGIVQTVSITNIIKQPNEMVMIYHDLLQDQTKQEKMLFKGEVVGSH